MGLFRDKELENQIAELRKYVDDRLDWQRKSIERRDSSISAAARNPRFDEIENKISDFREELNGFLDIRKDFNNDCWAMRQDIDKITQNNTKLEERISDLERENSELQVFKDFVEQLIRDASDCVIDISVYVEELQKVFNNAAELCGEPYQKKHEAIRSKIIGENNKLKWISPYEKEPEIGQEIFYKTADGQRHVGYILEKGLKPRKSRWFSDSMDPNDSNDMLDPDETTDEEYRVKEWLDENNAED